jgi:hypothetical protein
MYLLRFIHLFFGIRKWSCTVANVQMDEMLRGQGENLRLSYTHRGCSVSYTIQYVGMERVGGRTNLLQIEKDWQSPEIQV